MLSPPPATHTCVGTHVVSAPHMPLSFLNATAPVYRSTRGPQPHNARLPIATAAVPAAAAPLTAQVQLTAPPTQYDYKADILPETLEVVSQQHPELQHMVEAGNLVVYRRPRDYSERRTDGYQEPQLIFILGTAHVSQQSADDVMQLVAAVQPDAVVVELCKSRTGVLHAQDSGGGKPSQQQQQLAERQQRWQQQWQRWQQQRGRAAPAAGTAGAAVSAAATSSSSSQQSAAAAAAAASSSSATSSVEEEAAASTSSYSSSSDSSRSSSSSSSSSSFWGQLRSSLAAAQTSKASNPLSLSGGDPLSALARSASLGGQQAMLLRLLMAGQARKAADQLGMQPGAEFAAAARAAADVPGGQCCLVLGDRPIEITLSRAWEALSWPRRLQLLSDLATAGTAAQQAAALSPQQVEFLKSDDAVSALFAALSNRYPELVAPLITERDLYLSWSLKRSKAVNGARAVVGVVGKGHLRGIVYALKHDNGSLRFKDLVGGKNNRQTRRAEAAAAVRRLALELVLGAAAYAGWVAFTAGDGTGAQ